MSKNKEAEKKDFLISARKSIGPGLTNAPVWVMQKAGKRIWNKRQHRHWRSTNLGLTFKKKQAEQGKNRNVKRVKSGARRRLKDK
ncbi:MAG: hypothetical protein J4224_03795 [Candidatus Diapherotrites archaeon]|uniref:50S ribosomal protein L39e n=1 Tax=Candidatus Iainarchaeum sp. TaxID=3101447 RepID=A0A7J4IYZ7_9ARCH|nr:MAG: hypothetical protein QT03_C0001G1142 [archaeon GW2011_AR10]MBS3059516.1 hypothetical protein [Candidatus Diapherotrites archaeon]HIH09007.1 hypothetical protein [Candidatus Diapherotrites archaeon]